MQKQLNHNTGKDGSKTGETRGSEITAQNPHLVTNGENRRGELKEGPTRGKGRGDQKVADWGRQGCGGTLAEVISIDKKRSVNLISTNSPGGKRGTKDHKSTSEGRN